jgi:hypothetical protein
MRKFKDDVNIIVTELDYLYQDGLEIQDSQELKEQVKLISEINNIDLEDDDIKAITNYVEDNNYFYCDLFNMYL